MQEGERATRSSGESTRAAPPLRVAYVIHSFDPAYFYGGPPQVARHLTAALARRGCDVRVLTTNANGPDVLDVETGRELEIEPGLRIRYCRRRTLASHSPSLTAASPELLARIPSYARWADVLHVNSVYDLPTIPSLIAAKALGKPVAWSLHGGLQRWEGRSRALLKAVWELTCRAAAPRRLCILVTSPEEEKEARKRFPGTRVASIPHGVVVPPAVVSEPRGNRAGLRLLFLGRLDPIKGIENLLHACRLLGSDGELDWSLTLAGTGESGYEASLRELAETLQVSRRVRFAGRVVGEDKARLLGESDLMVVPSHSENFGMVVAESLAHELPVVASTGTPWSDIETVGCGAWVENTAEALAGAIRRLSEADLRECGRRGRAWMLREFQWDGIADRMIALYRDLLPTVAPSPGGLPIESPPARDSEGRRRAGS
jgi:glycosyltransferase involved in cell wall biosynthesis